MKKRVTGIGGVFFKSQNPEKTREWYNTHLGFNAAEYGGIFEWLQAENPAEKGTTVWNPFSAGTKYFEPSQHDYMFNYRVENLVELLEELRKEGVQVVGEMEEYDYGKFGWILDPEGRKIELWEPIDAKL